MDFKSLPHIKELAMSVEFLGGNSKELSQVFKESFLDIPHKISGSEESLPMAVIHYKAGKLNSRKAMIAPYLPKVNK